MPKSSTFLDSFCKVAKIIFLVKSFLGNFYRHWQHCTGHTGTELEVIILPVRLIEAEVELEVQFIGH